MVPTTTPPSAYYDAELYDWSLVLWRSASVPPLVLIGRVLNDKNGRIRTSSVLSPAEVESGQIVRTLNSRYYLLHDTKH
jgi:hypothetical protein